MKYLVVSIDGKEASMIIGKGIDVDKIVDALGAKVVSGGDAVVHQMFITCQGTITVKGNEVGSRGMKDEVLLRHADFIE
jgi:hypothetical protein